MTNYIPGVDRSHNNDPHPLADLVKKGIRFCIFKATQGLTYTDPMFNTSWQEAKATKGLIRGCYHFFNPRVDGIEQAKHYLFTNVNFTAFGCLPPIIDIEDLVGANPTNTEAQNKWVENNWKSVVERLHDFLNYVQSATGKMCIIYSYNGYLRDTLQGAKFPNNPLWLSSLQATCPKRYDTGELPLFWQYTYKWNNTDMDGDYFTGTLQELNKLANIT